MMKTVIALILMFSSALIPSAYALEAAKFQYSSGVARADREALQLDLARLNEARLPVGNAFWELELKAPATTENLKHWLTDRVQILVQSNHPFDASVIRKENKRFVILKNSTIDLSQFQIPQTASGPAKIQPNVLMTQLSGPFYLESKRLNTLRSILIQGLGWIEVYSPRVGIVRIGPALFEPFHLKTKDSPKDSYVNSINRLQTLFHEGRHSDGHGQNTTFPHKICPSGHTYQGRFACDDAINGGYRIGAETAKLLANDCQNCSEAEIEALLVLQADNWERILPSARSKDTRPESAARTQAQGTAYGEKR